MAKSYIEISADEVTSRVTIEVAVKVAPIWGRLEWRKHLGFALIKLGTKIMRVNVEVKNV